jgi:hypothetical protein
LVKTQMDDDDDDDDDDDGDCDSVLNVNSA